jgi:hypothetical protein
MEYLWFPFVVACILGFVGFRQWLRHQQRAMVHRERLSALEKGADLPPWPDDPPRSGIDFSGVLLLSGLIWLAIGLGGMFAAWIIVSHPIVQNLPDAVPPSIALIGVPVALIGVAHLIVYAAQRRRQR